MAAVRDAVQSPDAETVMLSSFVRAGEDQTALVKSYRAALRG